MKISEAKQIPLDEFLENLGHVCVRETSNTKWYNSPFRNELTASFKLSPDKTAWYDHGVGEGGNIFNLIFKMNGDISVPDALKFIEKTVGSGYTIPTIKQEIKRVTEPAYILTAVNPFQLYKGRSPSPAAQYLSSRGIDPVIMQPYLRDISFYHKDYPKQKITAFGIENTAGGYEVRTQRHGAWLKTCVGHKGFTHFLAERPEAPYFVFEGMPDFGTFLSVDKPPKGTYHYIILNSTSMTDQAIDYLKQQPRSTLIQCPQKGEAGDIAKEKLFKFANENSWGGGDIEYKFEGYGDYNEFHMAQLNLGKTVATPQNVPNFKPRLG
ncbi:toprim domain-containing protein [Dyadobacter sp. CY327]|uniref:toprim domain-containing protein n=1 Tax=Dyadobacter sp. CY327 TaxID=2907301 RepID=UPI001F2672F4|nr:toprim domain-containing protein [Dyadobacter sp. CY327]MCE7073704.1 toprim domain-containing protein [Dyadobacter sp. CY327]